MIGSSSMIWNTETENGQMVRLVDKPHNTVLRLASFDGKDISQVMQFPSTKRELLDLLQVRVVIFDDRIEVKAIFPIANINSQKCTSP